MTSMKKRISAALTAATLTIVLTIPAMAAEATDETVRVSSYPVKYCVAENKEKGTA